MSSGFILRIPIYDGNTVVKFFLLQYLFTVIFLCLFLRSIRQNHRFYNPILKHKCSRHWVSYTLLLYIHTGAAMFLRRYCKSFKFLFLEFVSEGIRKWSSYMECIYDVVYKNDNWVRRK